MPSTTGQATPTTTCGLVDLAAQALERGADVHDTGIKVDVFPTERESLTTAQAEAEDG
ncbi:hypothetical protein [Nonomuraea angiospora]